MTYEIREAATGKFSLFVNGQHRADYTRKSTAKRGLERFLAARDRICSAMSANNSTKLANKVHTEISSKAQAHLDKAEDLERKALAAYDQGPAYSGTDSDINIIGSDVSGKGGTQAA